MVSGALRGLSTTTSDDGVQKHLQVSIHPTCRLHAYIGRASATPVWRSLAEVMPRLHVMPSGVVGQRRVEGRFFVPGLQNQLHSTTLDNHLTELHGETAASPSTTQRRAHVCSGSDGVGSWSTDFSAFPLLPETPLDGRDIRRN
jgi:hypothetical protein